MKIISSVYTDGGLLLLNHELNKLKTAVVALSHMMSPLAGMKQNHNQNLEAYAHITCRSMLKIVISPQNEVLGSILFSACPSFCDSGFCSISLIGFVRFCSNLHHTLTIKQCICSRKMGAEGSVLQE